MNPNPLQISPVPQSLQDMIREAAYFKWLDGGCTHGDDWLHWLEAENKILAKMAAPPIRRHDSGATSSKHSLQATLAEHSSDPTHRFHGQGTAHDTRTDVIASGPRQRVRGRHFGGSLRSYQKQAK